MKIIKALLVVIKVLVSIPFMIVAVITQGIVNLLLREAMENFMSRHLGIDISSLRGKTMEEAKKAVEIAMLRKRQQMRNEED